ncbi:hypothetical protein NUW54_g14199 [Trametes sanguinea]|uniref:Uncharacterized protein n=1 Tax=Trametes sanguinea TaxID=158606 RepID=A0ACC1MF89_9APHY|nr:hypothetical protein NUW54_g14199 [Trametes sanguinea]
MSHTRDIDNEDPLFTFDSYEPLAALCGLEEHARVDVPRSLTPQDSPLSTPLLTSTLSPHWHSGSEPSPSTSRMNEQTSSPPKGKGVSRPMSIHHKEPLAPQVDSLTSLGPSSSNELVHSLGWTELPPPLDISSSRVTHPHDDAVDPALGENVGPSSGKGKARELPPSLPPLVFFPSENAAMRRRALDPTNWRTWFFRTDSPEAIKQRWEESKGELTAGWKRRHREAIKSRRRRGGGAGEGD